MFHSCSFGISNFKTLVPPFVLRGACIAGLLAVSGVEAAEHPEAPGVIKRFELSDLALEAKVVEDRSTPGTVRVVSVRARPGGGNMLYVESYTPGTGVQSSAYPTLKDVGALGNVYGLDSGAIFGSAINDQFEGSVFTIPPTGDPTRSVLAGSNAIASDLVCTPDLGHCAATFYDFAGFLHKLFFGSAPEFDWQPMNLTQQGTPIDAFFGGNGVGLAASDDGLAVFYEARANETELSINFQFQDWDGNEVFTGECGRRPNPPAFTPEYGTDTEAFAVSFHERTGYLYPFRNNDRVEIAVYDPEAASCSTRRIADLPSGTVGFQNFVSQPLDSPGFGLFGTMAGFDTVHVNPFMPSNVKSTHSIRNASLDAANRPVGYPLDLAHAQVGVNLEGNVWLLGNDDLHLNLYSVNPERQIHLPTVVQGGGTQTQIAISNAGMSPADVTVSYTQPDGTEAAESEQLTVPGNGTRILPGNPGGNLAVNWVEIATLSPGVQASATFTLPFAGAAPVTVLGTEPATMWTVPIGITDSQNSAFSINNPFRLELSYSVDVFDAEGSHVGTEQRTLPPEGQEQLFFNGLFENLLSGSGGNDFFGLARFSLNRPGGLLSLRQSPSGALTTVQATPGSGD